jgi:hypothetical protein
LISFPTGIEGIFATGVVFFVMGLAVGAIIKHAFKLGLMLLFAVIVLVLVGVITPTQVGLLFELFKPEATAVQSDINYFTALSSIVFAIGLALGLWKG